MVSFFLSNSDFPTYVATFSGQLYFGKSYFFTLFQSNCLNTTVTFFRTAISSEKLFYPEELFRIKISKKELIFQSRYFCKVSTFSEKIGFGKS